MTDGASNGGTRTLGWTYDPAAVNLDFLRQGETLTIRFAVTVSDGTSQAAKKFLVFTVRGTNDAPIIVASDPAFDVSETLTETNAALTTTGRVVFRDLDRNDTPAATVNTDAAVVTATGIALTAAQVDAFKDAFAITNAGTGEWAYNLPAAASQFLAAGDQVKIVYNVVVTDDFGASKTQAVTIIINGTNDGLTVTPLTGQSQFIEALNASAQNLPPTQGILRISDADSGNSLTAQIVGTPTLTYSAGALPAGTNLSALTALSALTLGSSTSNGGTTNIGWTYDPTAVNLDFLSVGETLTIRYAVAITDGTSTSPQILTFTIVGTNDGPTVDATAAVPFLEADDASAQDLNQGGSVSFNDIDANDVVDISASYNGDIVYSGGALPAGLAALLTTGTFAALATNAAAPGTTPWSYLANNVNLDFLDPGESITFSFTVTATDSQGATATDTVTITINGTDDGVTITGIGVQGGDETVDEDDLADGSSPERGNLTQTGSFTFSAPDGVDIMSVGIGGVLIVDNGVVTANVGVAINTTYGPADDHQRQPGHRGGELQLRRWATIRWTMALPRMTAKIRYSTASPGRYRHQRVHGQQLDHHQCGRRHSVSGDQCGHDGWCCDGYGGHGCENGADLSGAITLVEGADQDATLVVRLTGAMGGPLTFTLDGTAQSQSATVTLGGDELGVLTVAIAADGTATWTFNPSLDSTGSVVQLHGDGDGYGRRR